jgi:hypothetical protein
MPTLEALDRLLFARQIDFEDYLIQRAERAYWARFGRMAKNPSRYSMSVETAPDVADYVGAIVTLANSYEVLARYRWNGKRLVALAI